MFSPPIIHLSCNMTATFKKKYNICISLSEMLLPNEDINIYFLVVEVIDGISIRLHSCLITYGTNILKFNSIAFYSSTGGKKTNQTKQNMRKWMKMGAVHILLVKPGVLKLKSFVCPLLKLIMSRSWSKDCHFNAYENSEPN